MIKVERIEVWGFEHAIRGMRNPMNSWAKMDSQWVDLEYWDCGHGIPDGMGNAFVVGENDLDLMKRLFIGGSEHRKYLRQIFVSMDITAPLYWFKEFDTYKIGTTANSCSTMHKIHAEPITTDDFSLEYVKLCPAGKEYFAELEKLRIKYNETKDKKYWYALIQLLPSSYNQKRTVTMNYENVVNMIHQREFHKLDEWREFAEILKGLPYVKEIIGE